MAGITIRPAVDGDLAPLVDIYNHYVAHTPITFDVEPYTVETRRAWFDGFSSEGPYRLFVAEDDGRVLGHASSIRYRPKAAYSTSAEASIYLAPDATGRGIGSLLFERLLDELSRARLHRVLGGVTLPNPASVALMQKFGFRRVGVFSEQGYKQGRYWDVAWFERSLE